MQLTWLTSGTKGAETVLTIELIAMDNGTLVRLNHAGFPDQASCDQHSQAWPRVLEQLENTYLNGG